LFGASQIKSDKSQAATGYKLKDESEISSSLHSYARKLKEVKRRKDSARKFQQALEEKKQIFRTQEHSPAHPATLADSFAFAMKKAVEMKKPELLLS